MMWLIDLKSLGNGKVGSYSIQSGTPKFGPDKRPYFSYKY